MDIQTQASIKVLVGVAKDIRDCLKQINDLNDDISTKLKGLGNSFQDEGYMVVQDYISGAQKQVNDALPDLQIVMTKLLEYASLLQQSAGAIK